YETFMKSFPVKPPPVAGAIVGMDVRLVDESGAVLPQWVTMLHHVVFTNGGPDDQRGDPECPGHATRERFFGTSEELRPLTLPAAPATGSPASARGCTSRIPRACPGGSRPPAGPCTRASG